MKRTLLIVLSVLLISSIMYGCGKDKNENTKTTQTFEKQMTEQEKQAENDAKQIIAKVHDQGKISNNNKKTVSNAVNFIIKNIDKTEDEKTLLELIYNSSMINELSGMNNDKESYTDAEEELRGCNVAKMCDMIHTYVIDCKYENISEKQKKEVDVAVESVKNDYDDEIKIFTDDMIRCLSD
ncbi:MAG: hypothetical protein VB031_05540 [Eubacteriaceae bacterium]|nr:hypothetical protein [Eubacteriaceae bacterium]